jgi:hypothetical protein
MKRAGWVVASACAVAMITSGERIAGAHGHGDDERDGQRACNEATIRGNYGAQIQGTRPVPGGGSVFESVIGVVHRTYDGHGNIEQVDNVKGSVTGIVPDRPGFGTYEVNADCTGIARFQPGPGILIEERMVIVDDGREIRTITGSPAAVMVTGVQLRIHSR